jgi:hypothetical protein
MRFRLGVLFGMALGYYLGTKAGRQRYDQINRAMRRLRRTDAFETASDKAKSTLEDGVGKAKDLVGSRVGNGGGGDAGFGDGGNGDAPGNGMPNRFA